MPQFAFMFDDIHFMVAGVRMHAFLRLDLEEDAWHLMPENDEQASFRLHRALGCMNFESFRGASVDCNIRQARLLIKPRPGYSGLGDAVPWALSDGWDGQSLAQMPLLGARQEIAEFLANLAKAARVRRFTRFDPATRINYRQFRRQPH